MKNKNFRDVLSAMMLVSVVGYAQQREQVSAFQWQSKAVKDTICVVNELYPEVYLPIRIIDGKQEGPTFSVVAGIHGFEYPPIIALQELMAEIDPEKLSGRLILIPVANTASFYYRTPFVNPRDGKDLNKVFPGIANGTPSEQLAYLITTQVINRSDYFIDIHGGDAGECLLPFVGYYNRTDDMLHTAKAEVLTTISGFENVVVFPYDTAPEQPAWSAMKQAVRQGVTALSVEAGKLGNVQTEEVERIKQALYNMLAYADMYKTGITIKQEVKNIYREQTYMNSRVTGIFYSKLQSGDNVKEGDMLGYITDDFGNLLSEMISPVNGVVLYKTGTPPVNEGETIFCIAH